MYQENPVELMRHKATVTGRLIWIITLLVGFIGWIAWKWYALPIAIILALVLGGVYSVNKVKQIERETGMSFEDQERSIKR